MKKILIVMLGIMLIGNMSFGQNKYTPHVKGDDAILFSFSGLGFLAAFEYQGGFGYKKFLNDKTAIRGAFAIDNAKETTPWDSFYVPEGYVGEDGYEKEFGIGFETAVEISHNIGNPNLYYGGGFGLSITRTKFLAPSDPVPQGTPITQTEIKNNLDGNAATTFSVFALLGVEYAINSILSLAAEYHLGFSSSSQPDMKVDDGDGNETVFSGGKSSYFGITSVGLLTLAIYLN